MEQALRYATSSVRSASDPIGADRPGRSRGRFAPVGPEAPEVALGVAHGEAAGAVVLVAEALHHLGARRGGPGEQRVGLVGHDVDARRAGRRLREHARRRPVEPSITPPPRGQRSSAWATSPSPSPGTTRALLEAEGVDQEPRWRPGRRRSARQGQMVGAGALRVGHALRMPPARPAASWTDGSSSASHVVGRAAGQVAPVAVQVGLVVVPAGGGHVGQARPAGPLEQRARARSKRTHPGRHLGREPELAPEPLAQVAPAPAHLGGERPAPRRPRRWRPAGRHAPATSRRGDAARRAGAPGQHVVEHGEAAGQVGRGQAVHSSRPGRPEHVVERRPPTRQLAGRQAEQRPGARAA